MSEHKLKAPGKIKGQDYRLEQKNSRKVRARWAVVAEIGRRWPEKHVKGYLKAKTATDNKQKKQPAYRIEPMAEQQEELRHLPNSNLSWCLIRNEDDEPMSSYNSKEEAEIGLAEALAEIEK